MKLLNDLNNNIKNIHFIGISGISMSGIAIFIMKNYPHINVTGSTNIPNYQLESIIINGPIDHLKKENSIVIYTSGLNKEHTKLKIYFIDLGIKTLHRMEFINILTSNNKRILVTGAHGKTSTSTYLYNLLKNQDYGCFIGALLENNNSGINYGKNYIIEGDESDKSFLNIKNPDYLIVTNISTDHLDNYNYSFSEYLYTFESYFFHFDGLLIYNKNTFNLLESKNRVEESSNAYFLNQVVERTKVKNISYGYENCDVNIQIMESTNYLQWKIVTNHSLLLSLNNKIFTVNNIYGQWNIYNITAAIIVSTLEGLEVLSNINLIKPQRRMEEIYKDEKKIIIDDYGVHYTEIYSVIELCERKYGKGKVLYIWQPHRPSRILNLHNEFRMIFEPLGKKILYTDIYNASETNIIEKDEISTYINYGKHIEDNDLEKIIKDKKNKVIVLFNAGSLGSKVREIIKTMEGNIKK